MLDTRQLRKRSLLCLFHKRTNRLEMGGLKEYML